MSNPVPTSLTQGLGGTDDSVQLRINTQQILNAERWTVHEGILSQPAGFTITVGDGGTASSWLGSFQPGPNYEIQLYVGGALQQSGYLDSVGASQVENGATTVTLKGRDSLAPLQDTYVDGVIAANVATYPQLAWFALQKCGLAPSGPIDPNILQTDNSANRNFKCGVPIQVSGPLLTIQQILDGQGLPSNPTAGQVVAPPQAHLHETWHQFLRRHLDRAGLFFWAANDGSFVLSAPNANQQPTYLLRRKRGVSGDALLANVLSMNFQDDRTHRHSECIVYGKGGGKSFGRVKSRGDFQDQEMIDSGYAHQPVVFRDANCHSTQEAVYFARRKLAQERRAGWTLEYTVSGHTLPLATKTSGAGGPQRAVLTPDTVVQVDDEELGIQGNLYLESLERSRGAATTTKIKLMRPQDLVFGPEDV